MKSGDVLLIIKYQLKSEIFKYVEACNFCFKVRQFCVCVCVGVSQTYYSCPSLQKKIASSSMFASRFVYKSDITI